MVKTGTKKNPVKYGAKIQVWNRTALQTRHGIKRADLKRNKFGKIVYKKVSEAAKKTNNLAKHLNTVKGVNPFSKR